MHFLPLLLVQALLLAQAELLGGGLPLSGAPAPWSHTWDTAGAAYWGDFGYSLLTETQAAFVAKRYSLASLEKCTGRGSGLTTEAAIYQTAAQLKRHNPDTKVAFYWSTTQAGIECYDNNHTFMSHPDWWLRDDDGKVVLTNGRQKHPPFTKGNPRIDCTNEEAVAWWVSVPLNGTRAPFLIDAVLADAAGYDAIPYISSSRLGRLYTAKLAMIAKLQAEFDAVGRGGVVFGNGLGEYSMPPSDPDPHNRRILEAARGIQNEHFAAFEQVDPLTGSLLKDKVCDTLDQIEWAAAAANGSKSVFCSFWAGPYVTPSGAQNWPAYANGTQPCGTNCTSAEQYQGWRLALIKYLPFNLAAFLTVAQRNTWFTQAVWYEGRQGFFPCPEAPDTCATPDDFYADYLDRPLGPPLGARRKAAGSAYRWTREFEHATVTLDLDDPVGGSGVVFRT
jgi:hypothetical protein